MRKGTFESAPSPGVAGTSDSELLGWLTWFCLLGVPTLVTWLWREGAAQRSTDATPPS